MSSDKKTNLVWVDLEMTGLDINTDRIIEMACIITDQHLNVIEEGPDIVIHQSDDVMDAMGQWCVKHHGESGLTQEVKDSKISLQECERQMLRLIKRHTKKGKNCLAGSSVHCDKEFLKKYMPDFMDHLHYRIVDVSSVKELCRRWYPEEYATVPEKAMAHRALQDIKGSIEELKYYRSNIFKEIS